MAVKWTERATFPGSLEQINMSIFTTLISYGLIAYGGLIVASNCLDLIRNFSGSKESLVFCLIGIIFICIGWFSKSRELSDWQSMWSTITIFASTYKIWLWGAAISTIVGFVLGGLPGGALMELLNLIIDPLIAKPLNWTAPHGDTIWPTAIIYTLLTPWVSFGIYLAGQRLVSSSINPWIYVPSLTFACLIIFHIIFRYTNRS
jgi:hypothetical protein